jgi:hypothetical protein
MPFFWSCYCGLAFFILRFGLFVRALVHFVLLMYSYNAKRRHWRRTKLGI